MLSRIANKMKTFLGDSEGAVLAEFAITAPILVILGLGAAEIGRAVQHNHVVEKSARDAARYLSRVPASCAGGIANAADIATARNLAWTGYPTGATPLLTYWQNPNTTVTVTVSCYANTTAPILVRSNSSGTSIPLITVSVAVPYVDIGFLGLLGSAAITLRSNHSQVSIGG
jgi:Flp pilus assembly protein TadG